MNKKELQNNIDITQRVIGVIKEHHVSPKPKWQFMVQEVFVWILGLVTTFFGAIAVAVTLFMIAIVPARYYVATHDSIVKFWFEFLPMLWLVLFIAFIFATDYFLRKTKRGYKYSFIILTLASIFLSVLLGTIGFFIGLGELVEHKIGSRMPFHSPTETIIQKVWTQPSKGLLIGTFSSSTSELQTKDGEIFKLDLQDIPQEQLEYIQDGSHMSVIGTTTTDGVFYVCMILPLQDKKFILSSEMFERNAVSERINTCKGVRPYNRLQAKILKYEN